MQCNRNCALQVPFVCILALVLCHNVQPVRPPVTCHGAIPTFSEGKYYYHDNDTYRLRLTTTLDFKVDLHHRSCFEVDLESATNNTDMKVSSLFYVFEYQDYIQYYPIRRSYQFGIPEFRSYCKCDCPKADAFCTHAFDSHACSKGEICVTRYHPFQSDRGCSAEGPASLCCEISVSPYQNRRFTAINLRDPTAQAALSIEIYALYRNMWSLFRRYTRKIVPQRRNTLHLNGYENVADVYIFALAEAAQSTLASVDKYYFYEESPTFVLLDNPKVNDINDFDVNKLGWLRFKNHQWFVFDPVLSLQEIHKPQVTNCKEQKYLDRYAINSNIKVIRNSTGAINAEPIIGENVAQSNTFIETIALTAANMEHSNEMMLAVTYRASSAPTLRLDVTLHQKLAVAAHVHASFLADFVAKICLDKHSNRFLNITTIQSYGQFLAELYSDDAAQNVELVLSMVTSLPFASNYTEILPLPAFITSSRLICVFLERKPAEKLCKWTSFEKEPVEWFELRSTFVQTVGSCPGCNQDETSATFWDYLNPRKWLNGIGSWSEGLAMGLETVLYIMMLIVLILFVRKVLCPLLRWAVCSPAPCYNRVEKPALV